MRKKYTRTSGEWKDWALLGSALGNIFQGLNQASTKDTLKTTEMALQRVTEAKDYFEGKLREWQKAYSSLKAKVVELERDLSQYQNELSSLRKQLQAKDDEIASLKSEIKKHSNKS